MLEEPNNDGVGTKCWTQAIVDSLSQWIWGARHCQITDATSRRPAELMSQTVPIATAFGTSSGLSCGEV